MAAAALPQLSVPTLVEQLLDFSGFEFHSLLLLLF